jgi:hypothetical protein
MQELEVTLARVRSAWMAGRSALDHCPAEWREAVAHQHGEAGLAALTGHATSVLFRNVPGTALEPRPLLPALALPVIAEPLRPRFRRILTAKGGPSVERHLIDLIAARGHSVHPADWLPTPQDDWVPDVYAPWLDWVRTETRTTADHSALTIETYDRWPWAERRAELARLRIADPAAALLIIAAKAASEPAERRVRLLEILETRLSEADAEFLESLAGDRSERVQALARTYLARLGKVADTGDLAAELADTVTLGKVGLIKRRTRLVIKPLNNSAQKARRRELFTLVSVSALARALGVPEQQLVEAPPDGPPDDIGSFLHMMAATGSDAALHALLNGMLADDSTPVSQLRLLTPRLSAAERQALLPQIMARDAEGLEATLAIAGRELGAMPIAPLLASPTYTALSRLLDALNVEDPHRTSKTAALGVTLNRIALLLDAPGAADLVARVGIWGLSPADPKLDLLHLNAALTMETTP